ncbi:hypothetical protein TWF696_009610 [Orbilia brochopaga]|uniref:Uncharacterized protein n=1 Tax=Orbilia brochopaga TaxID=3140254 RepID=A0AAV9UFK2_9PEZI
MASTLLFVRVLLSCVFVFQTLYLAAAAPTVISDPGPDDCRISGLRSEKILADFTDHRSAHNPLGNLLPVGIYRDISWNGFTLGNSVLGTGSTNIFPIDAKAPYPITRFLVDELTQVTPGFTITFPNSPSRLFTLHSLNFHCLSLVVSTVPTSVLIECVVVFTPFVGGVRRTNFEAGFKPRTGSEIPGVITPKSPQAFVEFPETFCGVTGVEVSYKSGRTAGPVLGLGGSGVGVPQDIAMMAMDNVNYTLYYRT